MFSALKMIAKDNRAIAYRPEIAAILGGVTAAILLQQVAYWYNLTGRAFYKYRAPCDSSRLGDTWVEELGFSPAEFDYARKKIAARVKPAQTILLPQSLPTRLADESDAAYFQRLQKSGIFASLVIYWTDARHRTYYKINEPLFDALFALAYPASPDSANSNQPPVADCGNSNQQGVPVCGNCNHLFSDSANGYTEITTKTTDTDDTEINQPPQPRPHPVVVVDPVPPIPETVKTVFGEKRALGIIDEIKLRHGVATDYHRLAALCQSALDNPAVRSKGGWVIDAVAGDWRIDAPVPHDDDPYGYAKYAKWDTTPADAADVGTALLPSASDDAVGTQGCASVLDDAPPPSDGDISPSPFTGRGAGGGVNPTARVHLTQPLGDQTLSAQEIWDRACAQLVADYGCLFEPVLHNLTLVDFDPAIRQFTAVFRLRSDLNLDFQTTHGAIRQALMRLCGTRDIQLRFAPHFRWRPPTVPAGAIISPLQVGEGLGVR